MSYYQHRCKGNVSRSNLCLARLMAMVLFSLYGLILVACATSRPGAPPSEAGQPGEARNRPVRVAFLGLRGADEQVAPEQRQNIERAVLETLIQSVRPDEVEVVTPESENSGATGSNHPSDWTDAEIWQAAKDLDAVYVMTMSFTRLPAHDDVPTFWTLTSRLCKAKFRYCETDVACAEAYPWGTRGSVEASVRRLLEKELAHRRGVTLRLPPQPEDQLKNAAESWADAALTQNQDKRAKASVNNIEYLEVTSLKKLHSAFPHFPPEALRDRTTGKVLVEVTCKADGTVFHVEWLDGPTVFQTTVYNAVMQWRFAPRPTPFKFKQPFNFSTRRTYYR